MSKSWQYLILPIVCIIHTSLISQDISFKNISTTQGLSSNLVYNACQGPDGLLWIIASNRLDSYHEGKVTNYDNDLIPGIEDYRLFEILIDSDNIIWLKTVDGEVIYLDRNRRIKEVKIPGRSSTKILNLLRVESDDVDMLTKEGHFHFNVENQTLDTIHLFEEPIYSVPALQISDEGEGRYLISESNRIKLYDAQVGKVIFDFDAVSTRGAVMINHNQIVASSPNHNELFLISIDENKIIRNLAVDINKKYPQTNTFYRRIKHIDKDHIAITSGHQGLFILNVHDFSIENYAHDFANPGSISSDNSYMLFTNNNGNVYVTTRTSGLNIFNPNRHNARHIRSFADHSLHNIFEGHISHIARDRSGQYWLASAQGLLKYNDRTKVAEMNVFKNPNDEILSIISLHIDDYNRIWLGISGGGIAVVDRNGKKISSFQSDPSRINSLQSNLVYSMVKGFDGKLWIGTSRGIDKIDLNVYPLRLEAREDPSKDLNTSIREIKTIGTETFVGTWRKGSYVFSKEGMIKISEPENYNATHITVFAKDGNGRLYQGTPKGVLISSFDKAEANYVFLEKILTERILSIDNDKAGYLWIGTENILYKYDPVKREMEKFTDENGFTGGGIRMHASYLDTDGILHYGMNTGMCQFDPKVLDKFDVSLNPYITAIYEGSNKTLLTQNESISLSAKRNNIGVYYQNYDIWNTQHIQYQYSISGDDLDWVLAITNPILIQNINPGRYNVRLRASLDGDTWLMASNEISLKIAFPWWRSWWFYALAFSLGGIGIYFAYKLYMRLRNERLEKIKYDESLKFFSFSMHKYADMDKEFWDVTLECIRQLDIDACAIYLKDTLGKQYRRQAASINSSKHQNYLDGAKNILFGKSTIDSVGRSGKPIVIKDLSHSESENNIGTVRFSKITIPILSNDRILGVIDCEHEAKDYFNERHLSFLSAISTIVATKIEAYRSEEDRKDAELSLSNNLKKVSELEMKSLRSQMNPHFMFNSLNSINNFIVKNDQENASDYLTNFARLMRIILENSRQDWVTLESELEALRLYIEMEKLRFENQFFYHECISENINVMSTLVPPMLIQPYIENAIWHGLLSKKSAHCNLKLSIDQSDDLLVISIDDDGIGINKSKRNKSNFNISKKSFGLKIISERLDMINKIYNLNAQVQVLDKSNNSKNETGTRVILSMKVKIAE